MSESSRAPPRPGCASARPGPTWARWWRCAAGWTTTARAARSSSWSCGTARGPCSAWPAQSDLPAEQWEALGALTQESALIVRGSLRADARAPGRRGDGPPVGERGVGGRALPDHAQGARHRLPDGPPAPVAALVRGSTPSCGSGRS